MYPSTPLTVPISGNLTQKIDISFGEFVSQAILLYDDFKTLAKGADTVSFLFRETEKGFQADALKDGRVMTFSGDLPKDAKLLKLWLAEELGVAEEQIFEGRW